MSGWLTRSPLSLFVVSSLAVAAALSGCGADDADPADLILHNARIWTGDDERPWAEAVAVRGDRIVLVGSDADVRALRGRRTEVRDLGGRFVSPGFIDNHTHFNRAGELLLGINLLAVSDAEGLVREVEATASRLPGGAWMVGGMWGAYEEWALSSTGREGEEGAYSRAWGRRSRLSEPETATSCAGFVGWRPVDGTFRTFVEDSWR